MWFGFTYVTRVVIVAVFAFLPILLNVWWGVRALEPGWIAVGRAFCATRGELLSHVVLPGTVGSVLASLRLGGGLALIGLFVAEMYGATRGIGYQAIAGAKRMDITGVLAGLVLLGALGMLLERSLVLAEIFVGSLGGIGYFIITAGQQFQSADVFAGALLMAVTGCVLTLALERLRAWLTPWSRSPAL
jgi:ABC-type nitrate/sulfonate/bicarbonate transport system permease component